jgi:putative redox protein
MTTDTTGTTSTTETADARPPMTLSLTWDGDLRFAGLVGSQALVLDGDAHAGPSPMQALAAALAGCMAIDVVAILQKGRHPLRGLHTRLTGRRADAQPARFDRIALHVEVCGEVPAEAVERALALSRDKYCSVWHSLRQDIELTVTFEISGS